MNPIMQKLGDDMASIFGNLAPHRECESCGEKLDEWDEDECPTCILAGQAEYNREHDARAER